MGQKLWLLMLINPDRDAARQRKWQTNNDDMQLNTKPGLNSYNWQLPKAAIPSGKFQSHHPPNGHLPHSA